MNDPPRISIVTSSYNQGRFIARTIESVLAQGYPDVEHVVVDGMSSDETPAVLARYPHLRVLREPDRGQAEAINKGFRLATGDILCFLNSDDTLLLGALWRVARELDPARGRFIVVGRCLYIDEEDRPTGEEHPCAYHGHLRLLEAWRPHTIPQPATFWAAEVWRRCGPLNEDEQLVLDYELFCRFSRHYDFHVLDDALATYRLHAHSKSCANAQRAFYRRALRTSWRHWPGPASPAFWRLALSFVVHRWRRASTRLTAEGWALRQRGRLVLGWAATAAGALLGPGLAAARAGRRLLAPWTNRVGVRPYRGDDSWRSGRLDPCTLNWRGFTGAHADGCVGPTYRTLVDLTPGQAAVRIEVGPPLACGPDLGPPDVLIGGRRVPVHTASCYGGMALLAPVEGLGPGRHELVLRARAFVVPDDYLGNRDYRPLSYRLLAVSATARAPAPSGEGPARDGGLWRSVLRPGLVHVYRRLGRPLAPRLGVLWQYPARPLRLPGPPKGARAPEALPVLSIVTPSFNQGRFLERTLRSVLEQNYPRLEHIVQDGGSTDETVEVLKRFADRLCHWESRRDAGQADAINRGFRHATGEVMAYLNSDDLLLPGALAYVGQFFAGRPEVDVVYGHRIVIDEDDREVGRWVLPPHDDRVLTWKDYVPQEALFWRRRIWERVGGRLDESFQFALDWDLLLRFREAGAVFARAPRFLGAFRAHREQKTSARMEDLGAREIARLRLRTHGRPVTEEEAERRVRRYLRAHVWHDALWRLGLVG
jgi:glycosyltransferase involved in cell wall biosynthesis